MAYTPNDILEYVMSHELDSSFLVSMAMHKGNYSIGEIADKEFEVNRESGQVRFKSAGYQINVLVNDEDVMTAVMNGLYVSAFISRKEEAYNLHFLVHHYPLSMKPQFEEEITKEVVRYMILNTIIALRLDTKEKIRQYCS